MQRFCSDGNLSHSKTLQRIMQKPKLRPQKVLFVCRTDNLKSFEFDVKKKFFTKNEWALLCGLPVALLPDTMADTKMYPEACPTTLSMAKLGIRVKSVTLSVNDSGLSNSNLA